MAAVRVIYATGEGQTAKVAERIVSVLRSRGHDATAIDVEFEDPDLGGADAVLVGSSIHVGRHAPSIVSFLEGAVDRLGGTPTGFFQVSLSSADPDQKRRAEAAGYVDDLLERTGFAPDRIGLFGGALRYSKYGFVKRLLLKRIAAESTGDTDTSRDYEYTDWAEVEAFANDFGAFVEARHGGA